LLVSPYARKGFIDNTQLDFTSVLKFIEQNWNVPSLAGRDAAANNFLKAFDFTQSPRLPDFISSVRASNTANTRKDPSRIIYTTYGLAIMLSALVIGIAFVSRYFLRPKLVENHKK